MNRTALSALVLALVATTQDPARSPETARLFREWVESTKDRSDYPPPVAEDPAYETLLRAPDADLFFLDTARPWGGNHVETFSAKGLAALHSERTIQSLLKETGKPDRFVRERALGLLSKIGGDDARRALLAALKDDKELGIRSMAADQLRDFPSPDTEEALIAALEQDPTVAARAAHSLGLLGTVRAAGRIRRLIGDWKSPELLRMALDGIRGLRSIEAAGYLVELLCKPPEALPGAWKEQWRETCEISLRPYVDAVRKEVGPEPDTMDQWADWWARARPLFDANMAKVEKPRPTWAPQEFGMDGSALRLRAALDERTYRVGDPIRLELSLENPTDRPFRTRLPRAPSEWWNTMGYGIRLERMAPAPTAIQYEIAPSPEYMGSYSGPPASEVLAPGETFRHRVCYQYFLLDRKAWPTREGTYRLTVTFDSGAFAGVRPVAGEVLHRWTAPAVEFRVEGPPRLEGAELVDRIGKKAGSRWFRSDLESRKGDRKNAAWDVLREYGDSRLVPFVRKELGPEGSRLQGLWGDPRPFFDR